MPRALLLLLAVAAATASATWPETARACSPFEPLVMSTVPADMGTHPANAGIAIIGHSLGAAGLTATVDDEPVAVLFDEGLSERDLIDYRVVVVRTEPAPTPGQVVRFQGSACPEDELPCPDAQVDVEFIAGEPDLEAPAPPLAVALDGYDHGSVPSSCAPGCSFYSDRYAITVDAAIAKPEGEMTMHVLGLRPQNAPNASPTIVQRSWGHHTFGLEGSNTPPTTPPCAVAQTVDLAGNQSAVVESCTLCRVQINDPECSFLCGGDYPCDEPTFTCESIVNPDACLQGVLDECDVGGTTGGATTTGGDTGTTTGADSTTTASSTTAADTTTTDVDASGSEGTSAGADTPESGCACALRAPGESPAPAALAFVALLAASRRRRAPS